MQLDDSSTAQTGQCVFEIAHFTLLHFDKEIVGVKDKDANWIFSDSVMRKNFKFGDADQTH